MSVSGHIITNSDLTPRRKGFARRKACWAITCLEIQRTHEPDRPSGRSTTTTDTVLCVGAINGEKQRIYISCVPTREENLYYNEHIETTIDILAKQYLGKFGIVGVSDGIWDAGPVPGRPQGGPFSTCIFIFTTAKQELVQKLVPIEFNGYKIVVQRTKPFVPLALGMYGKKLGPAT